AGVFETATFYAHFDVVKEGEANIPRLTVRVCDSITCAMFGADELLETLQRELASDAVRVVRAPCVGLCDHAPAVEVGPNFLHKADAASVRAAVEAEDT
ncbi:NADH-quinone oxidoreductase subunit F, partial [Bacillus amyloliquefaciens]|nr:NADH-quinone oxidoreductase subunit F [Bacillus amyloliquefaciens]